MVASKTDLEQGVDPEEVTGRARTRTRPFSMVWRSPWRGQLRSSDGERLGVSAEKGPAEPGSMLLETLVWHLTLDAAGPR